MITNPRIGDQYQIWYRKSLRHLPYHGHLGIAVIRSKKRPRNHLIQTGNDFVVVPCGNIRKINGKQDHERLDNKKTIS